MHTNSDNTYDNTTWCQHSSTYSGHSCPNLPFMFTCPSQSYCCVYSSFRMSLNTCRQDKSTQGCLMHSSNFLRITSCSCHSKRTCVCLRRCVFNSFDTQSWVITQHIIPYDGLLFPYGHDDPAWYSHVVRKYASALMWEEMHIRPSPMGGTLLFRLHPCSLGLLHSWSSSLLSCNCSPVLGNRGRKSQSFRRATMTIKNIQKKKRKRKRKVRKRGRKCFSWDERRREA